MKKLFERGQVDRRYTRIETGTCAKGYRPDIDKKLR